MAHASRGCCGTSWPAKGKASLAGPAETRASISPLWLEVIWLWSICWGLGWMDCRFFFSSRRRHTTFDCDWSSGVCSSDLAGGNAALGDDNPVAGQMRSGRTGKAGTAFRRRRQVGGLSDELERDAAVDRERVQVAGVDADRSEERRVGKEGRSRWSPHH